MSKKSGSGHLATTGVSPLSEAALFAAQLSGLMTEKLALGAGQRKAEAAV